MAKSPSVTRTAARAADREAQAVPEEIMHALPDGSILLFLQDGTPLRLPAPTFGQLEELILAHKQRLEEQARILEDKTIEAGWDRNLQLIGAMRTFWESVCVILTGSEEAPALKSQLASAGFADDAVSHWISDPSAPPATPPVPGAQETAETTEPAQPTPDA